jgi:hypothetical protein
MYSYSHSMYLGNFPQAYLMVRFRLHGETMKWDTLFKGSRYEGPTLVLHTETQSLCELAIQLGFAD